MANTTSWAFPKIFDATTNKVNIYEDEKSVVNRCRLLMLTEPTELYMNPRFGVGLKRFLWQYNTTNTRPMIEDRIREQIRVNEPCVDADDIQFSSNTVEDPNKQFRSQEYNRLDMSVGLKTTFGGTVIVPLSDEITRWSDDGTYTNTDELALTEK